MEQDHKKKNEELNEEDKDAPNLKERIEKLQENNEFLKEPMKENIKKEDGDNPEKNKA